MRAIVLSGGGALGSFEAGAIKALDDEGITFRIISGSSIGAINASFLAQGKAQQLADFWHNISTLNPPIIQYIDTVSRVDTFIGDLDRVMRGDILEIPGLIDRWMQIGSKRALMGLRGIVKPDAIEHILSENLDYDALRSCLIIPVTNLTYGSSEAFFAFVGDDCDELQAQFLAKGNSDNLHQLSPSNFVLAVRSSAAIPGFFEPVSMNLGSTGEKEFVDGGVANNTPVTLAIQAGATDLVVIMLQPEATSNEVYQTSNILEIGMASFTAMQQRLLERDMQSAAQTSGVTVKCVRPAGGLPVNVLEFNDQKKLDAAFDAGYAAVRSAR